MKSAYELAMERLRASEPDTETGAPLSDQQKKQLAELDAEYKAKIAERDVFLQDKLRQSEAAGSDEEAEKLRRQIADERARLEEERDEKKDRVRAGMS